MELKERLLELIDKEIEKNPSLFLIDLKITPNSDVEVVMDSDDGLSVEDCIEINKSVAQELDAMGIDFSLEVGSPGAFSPLLKQRQYAKNKGRTLRVEEKDGKTTEGVLKEVEQEFIVIENKTREPKAVGKGKVTVVNEHKIAFENIKQASVVIKF